VRSSHCHVLLSSSNTKLIRQHGEGKHLQQATNNTEIAHWVKTLSNDVLTEPGPRPHVLTKRTKQTKLHS